jgi:hypothetical protein
MFIPITPAIYPDDQLPELVAYPWHIVHEKLLDEEERLLQQDGLAVTGTATLWDADGKLPLEICWIVARMNAVQLMLVITPHNYPEGAPSLRTAPFERMSANDDVYDLFARVWSKSEPVEVPYDPAQHKTLLEYVLAAEAKLGIKRTQTRVNETVPPTKEVAQKKAGKDEDADTEDD